MKTAELIDMLAATDPRAPRSVWLSRHALAVSLGISAALLALLFVLGVRDDIAAAAVLPMFWVKQVFPLFLLVAAFFVILRLSRPGLSAGPAVWPVLMAVGGVWLLALMEWFETAPGQRGALLFGQTWRECLINIPLLSVPAFLAVFLVLRSMAPTRPALAGGVAGFLAGCTGAFAYAVHCPELSAPFIGIWYLLGMLIPACIGTLLGGKLLRW